MGTTALYLETRRPCQGVVDFVKKR